MVPALNLDRKLIHEAFKKQWKNFHRKWEVAGRRREDLITMTAAAAIVIEIQRRAVNCRFYDTKSQHLSLRPLQTYSSSESVEDVDDFWASKFERSGSRWIHTGQKANGGGGGECHEG